MRSVVVVFRLRLVAFAAAATDVRSCFCWLIDDDDEKNPGYSYCHIGHDVQT